MEHLSVQFAKQARSDLGMAQAIAIANESGDALGTAMFLAQQSMEKQFKSALLMAGEAIEASLDGKFVIGALDHVIHHQPATFYQKCLEGIGRPCGPEPGDSSKTVLEQLEQILPICSSCPNIVLVESSSPRPTGRPIPSRHFW